MKLFLTIMTIAQLWFHIDALQNTREIGRVIAVIHFALYEIALAWLMITIWS